MPSTMPTTVNKGLMKCDPQNQGSYKYLVERL